MATYTRTRSKYKKHIEKNTIQAMRFAEAIKTSYNPQQIKSLIDKKNQALVNAKKENALYTNNSTLWDKLDVLDEAIKILSVDAKTKNETPAKNPISQAISSLINTNEKEKRITKNNTTIPIAKSKNPFQVMTNNDNFTTVVDNHLVESNNVTSPFKKEVSLDKKTFVNAPVFIV